MCLVQGHNTVALVRLKPAVPRSRVKHSTTEPLRSLNDSLAHEKSTKYAKSENTARSKISRGFYFRETSHMLGFAQINPCEMAQFCSFV